MKLALTATVVVASALLVAAQDTSKCPDETYQSIIRCTDQVYADEGKAPCSSSDWEVSTTIVSSSDPAPSCPIIAHLTRSRPQHQCICQIQQGLLSCYDPCPEAQEADAIRFNNENCAGQHGVKNKAAGGTMVYTLSPITTTGLGSGGSGGSGGSTTSAPNS